MFNFFVHCHNNIIVMAGMKKRMDALIKKSKASCSDDQGQGEATVVPPKNLQREMPPDHGSDRDMDEVNM